MRETGVVLLILSIVIVANFTPAESQWGFGLGKGGGWDWLWKRLGELEKFDLNKVNRKSSSAGRGGSAYERGLLRKRYGRFFRASTSDSSEESEEDSSEEMVDTSPSGTGEGVSNVQNGEGFGHMSKTTGTPEEEREEMVGTVNAQGSTNGEAGAAAGEGGNGGYGSGTGNEEEEESQEGQGQGVLSGQNTGQGNQGEGGGNEGQQGTPGNLNRNSANEEYEEGNMQTQNPMSVGQSQSQGQNQQGESEYEAEGETSTSKSTSQQYTGNEEVEAEDLTTQSSNITPKGSTGTAAENENEGATGQNTAVSQGASGTGEKEFESEGNPSTTSTKEGTQSQQTWESSMPNPTISQSNNGGPNSVQSPGISNQGISGVQDQPTKETKNSEQQNSWVVIPTTKLRNPDLTTPDTGTTKASDKQKQNTVNLATNSNKQGVNWIDPQPVIESELPQDSWSISQSSTNEIPSSNTIATNTPKDIQGSNALNNNQISPNTLPWNSGSADGLKPWESAPSQTVDQPETTQGNQGATNGNSLSSAKVNAVADKPIDKTTMGSFPNRKQTPQENRPWGNNLNNQKQQNWRTLKNTAVAPQTPIQETLKGTTAVSNTKYILQELQTTKPVATIKPTAKPLYRGIGRGNIQNSIQNGGTVNADTQKPVVSGSKVNDNPTTAKVTVAIATDVPGGTRTDFNAKNVGNTRLGDFVYQPTDQTLPQYQPPKVQNMGNQQDKNRGPESSSFSVLSPRYKDSGQEIPPSFAAQVSGQGNELNPQSKSDPTINMASKNVPKDFHMREMKRLIDQQHPAKVIKQFIEHTTPVLPVQAGQGSSKVVKTIDNGLVSEPITIQNEYKVLSNTLEPLNERASVPQQKLISGVPGKDIISKMSSTGLLGDQPNTIDMAASQGSIVSGINAELLLNNNANINGIIKVKDNKAIKATTNKADIANAITKNDISYGELSMSIKQIDTRGLKAPKNNIQNHQNITFFDPPAQNSLSAKGIGFSIHKKAATSSKTGSNIERTESNFATNNFLSQPENKVKPNSNLKKKAASTKFNSGNINKADMSFGDITSRQLDRSNNRINDVRNTAGKTKTIAKKQASNLSPNNVLPASPASGTWTEYNPSAWREIPGAPNTPNKVQSPSSNAQIVSGRPGSSGTSGSFISQNGPGVNNRRTVSSSGLQGTQVGTPPQGSPQALGSRQPWRGGSGTAGRGSEMMITSGRFGQNNAWKAAAREEARELAIEKEGTWKAVNITTIGRKSDVCPIFNVVYQDNAVIVDTGKNNCKIVITWHHRPKSEPVTEQTPWGVRTYYRTRMSYVPVVTYVKTR